MKPPTLFRDALNNLEQFTPADTIGKVRKVDPMLITAHLPEGRMGELVLLGPPKKRKTSKRRWSPSERTRSSWPLWDQRETSLRGGR